MAAEIDRDRGEARIRQASGDGVHLPGRAGRAVTEEDNRSVPAASDRIIEPIGEPGSVASLEPAEPGQSFGIDLQRAVQHGRERCRGFERTSQHDGQGDGAETNKAEQPEETVEDEQHDSLPDFSVEQSLSLCASCGGIGRAGAGFEWRECAIAGTRRRLGEQVVTSPLPPFPSFPDVTRAPGAVIPDAASPAHLRKPSRAQSLNVFCPVRRLYDRMKSLDPFDR